MVGGCVVYFLGHSVHGALMSEDSLVKGGFKEGDRGTPQS